MPQKGRYNLIFEGIVLEGQNSADVKKRIAGLLKADIKRIEQLFVKAPVTLKSNIDYPTASKLKEAMRIAGAGCKIKRIDNATERVKPPPFNSARMTPRSGSLGPDSAESETKIPDTPVRPGKIFYVIAALLAIVPTIWAGIKIPVTLFTYLNSGTQFIAPGNAEVTIEKPGTYILWFPLDDGRYYHRNVPNDMKIAVYDDNSERYLNAKLPGWQSIETIAGVERQAIAEILFDQAGVYRIKVSGDFPAAALVLRQSLGWGIFSKFVVPVLICLMGIFCGLAMAFIVFLKRSNMKSRAMQPVITHQEERKWAMLSHLGTFSAFFIPFGNIIAPLVIWQIKKRESSFVVQHSKESLNFQISLLIYYFVATLLALIIIGFLLFIGLFILNIIFVIFAGLKAIEGENYRYPITFRFFKF